MILSDQCHSTPNKQRLPSILLSNARSIFPKMDELRLLNSLHHTSIIAITESWLTDNIDSSLLYLTNHIFYRCDRTSGRGGGVCVWCNTSLQPELIPIERHHSVELLALFLRKIDCLFIVIYIPPGLGAEDNRSINALTIDITDSHLRLHPNSEIILCGDFNQHKTSDFEASLYLSLIHI